jgi:hypothetical protein
LSCNNQAIVMLSRANAVNLSCMIEALRSGETLEAGGESPSGGVGEALGSGEVKVKDLK